MGSDLIFLVGVALLSFAAKSYSSIVSLAFEKLYIKFFRTLTPGYWKSYVRAFFLSLISFRNQGVSFTALSFVNSGIIPSFQALGLILGSYLGLTVSLFVLNLHNTELKFILVSIALILSIYTTKSKASQVARFFFYMAMILFGFELILISIFSSDIPVIIIAVNKLLTISRLLLIPFVLILLGLRNQQQCSYVFAV